MFAQSQFSSFFRERQVLFDAVREYFLSAVPVILWDPCYASIRGSGPIPFADILQDATGVVIDRKLT